MTPRVAGDRQAFLPPHLCTLSLGSTRFFRVVERNGLILRRKEIGNGKNTMLRLPPGASFLNDQKGCKESPKGEDFVFSPLWKPLIETTQGAPAPWIPCKGNCFRFSAVGVGVLDDPAEYARFLPISGESAPRFNLIIPCFNLIILA